MADSARDIHGVRTLVCCDDGAKLEAERDANDFLSAAWEHQASMVAISVARLTDAFFRLETRLAGETIQKFVNYQLRLAIVGSIAAHMNESRSLRDFVYEANRGRSVWFVDDLESLALKLEAQRG
ncbi:DUF4180 domain-containing protein [Methylosinus sp. H3A]|uniref:DUF4180 domain-containing protein n=1 Tax=Methylosinus sp. H3A TaxID=2785786 RepID=UPI0018C1DB58|nr:DUF4180 domain-containing protein [Methylosinus sp. H3A]MBG0809197.1 DUF4180 domain-containing protein [Methylosinus sp. H3A]